MPTRLSKCCVAVIALAASAAGAAQMTLEDAILDEINFARTQPQDYADMLRQYRGSYQGNVVDDPDEAGIHTTREGVRAVDEAIAFLKRQRPLPPLASGRLLSLAAVDHAVAQGRRGDTGHISANGLTPGQRVTRRGGGTYVAETIAYGFATPIAVVRQLIVDDGVANRGHRSIIFTPSLRYAGVGCGSHPTYSAMCVIDFSPTADGRYGRSAEADVRGRSAEADDRGQSADAGRDDRDGFDDEDGRAPMP